MDGLWYPMPVPSEYTLEGFRVLNGVPVLYCRNFTLPAAQKNLRKLISGLGATCPLALIPAKSHTMIAALVNPGAPCVQHHNKRLWLPGHNRFSHHVFKCCNRVFVAS